MQLHYRISLHLTRHEHYIDIKSIHQTRTSYGFSEKVRGMIFICSPRFLTRDESKGTTSLSPSRNYTSNEVKLDMSQSCFLEYRARFSLECCWKIQHYGINPNIKSDDKLLGFLIVWFYLSLFVRYILNFIQLIYQLISQSILTIIFFLMFISSYSFFYIYFLNNLYKNEKY